MNPLCNTVKTPGSPSPVVECLFWFTLRFCLRIHRNFVLVQLLDVLSLQLHCDVFVFFQIPASMMQQNCIIRRSHVRLYNPRVTASFICWAGPFQSWRSSPAASRPWPRAQNRLHSQLFTSSRHARGLS